MQIFYEYSFHHALWRSIKLQRIESKKKKWQYRSKGRRVGDNSELIACRYKIFSKRIKENYVLPWNFHSEFASLEIRT